MLPYGSVAVTVAVWPVPAVWVAVPVTTRREAAAALTAIVRRSPPAEVMLPSLATMLAVSVL